MTAHITCPVDHRDLSLDLCDPCLDLCQRSEFSLSSERGAEPHTALVWGHRKDRRDTRGYHQASVSYPVQ